jgi:uncharacterized protein
MSEKNPYIGRGWGFPPTFVRAKRGVEMVVDETEINQSLEILFSTSKGERVMQPRFGANLDSFLFDPIDNTTGTFLKEMIKEAILYFEPRIRVIKVEITKIETEGKIDIHVIYEIKATNSRFNFVYPFYITEKSEGKK